MSTQLEPPVSQRRHWRVSVGVGEPDQVPSLPVRTELTAAAPLIVGSAVFDGGTVIVLVAADSAVAALTELVPVTFTRIRLPASAPARRYDWLVAPAMLTQFAPAESQRSH